MVKNIFRPVEIVDLTAQKVEISAPVFETFEPEPIEIYDGPKADDLRREAEEFKVSWEEERARMIEAAQQEVAHLRREFEESIADEKRIKEEEAREIQRLAEEAAASIRLQAEQDAQNIRAEVEAEKTRVFNEAQESATKDGMEAGWEEGRAEMERLVERLHKVIDATIAKRRDIVVQTESQIIDLVLLIAGKVVKVISEQQKNVVIQNILQALKKLKHRGDISIRVNLADLQLSTDHIKDFIAMVENVEAVTVLEDSSVSQGGAIIETDFGEIDARIASQLREIEDKIIHLAPMKSTGDIAK